MECWLGLPVQPERWHVEGCPLVAAERGTLPSCAPPARGANVRQRASGRAPLDHSSVPPLPCCAGGAPRGRRGGGGVAERAGRRRRRAHAPQGADVKLLGSCLVWKHACMRRRGRLPAAARQRAPIALLALPTASPPPGWLCAASIPRRQPWQQPCAQAPAVLSPGCLQAPFLPFPACPCLHSSHRRSSLCSSTPILCTCAPAPSTAVLKRCHVPPRYAPRLPHPVPAAATTAAPPPFCLPLGLGMVQHVHT